MHMFFGTLLMILAGFVPKKVAVVCIMSLWLQAGVHEEMLEWAQNHDRNPIDGAISVHEHETEIRGMNYGIALAVMFLPHVCFRPPVLDPRSGVAIAKAEEGARARVASSQEFTKKSEEEKEAYVKVQIAAAKRSAKYNIDPSILKVRESRALDGNLGVRVSSSTRLPSLSA